MNALAVHYDLNFGSCMQVVSGGVTTKWIIKEDVLNACKLTSSPEDLISIEQSLMQGCPIDFTWEETPINKEMSVCRGNYLNVNID